MQEDIERLCKWSKDWHLEVYSGLLQLGTIWIWIENDWLPEQLSCTFNSVLLEWPWYRIY